MANGILSIGKMRLAEPLDDALAHMRRLMFRPFNAGIWLRFGVIIFIEMLLWNWGSYSGGSSSWENGIPFSPEDISESLEDGATLAVGHVLVFAGIAAVSLLTISLVMILHTWVTSRGQLMFARAVARGDARIGVNWSETRSLSQSLFVFRLLINFLGLAYFAVLTLLCGVAFLAFSRFSDSGREALLAVVFPAVALGFLGTLAWWLVSALLREFVVPLMLHFDVPCGEGWRIFRRVAQGNVPALVLYFVARFVLHMFIAMASLMAGCFTCFIGFLPLIHHTLLAPLYVFERSFGIFVLQSLGPDFQMVRQPGIYRDSYERGAWHDEDY